MGGQIEKAIALLRQQGHTVKPHNRDGKFWFEIDGRMLASHQEKGELADCVYSLEELEGLFKKRRVDEQNGNRP
jgi:hypothetical protein